MSIKLIHYEINIIFDPDWYECYNSNIIHLQTKVKTKVKKNWSND